MSGTEPCLGTWARRPPSTPPASRVLALGGIMRNAGCGESIMLRHASEDHWGACTRVRIVQGLGRAYMNFLGACPRYRCSMMIRAQPLRVAVETKQPPRYPRPRSLFLLLPPAERHAAVGWSDEDLHFVGRWLPGDRLAFFFSSFRNRLIQPDGVAETAFLSCGRSLVR